MLRRLALLAILPLLLTLLLPAPWLAADKAAEPTADVTLDPDMDEGHRQFAHANYEKALEHYLKALERNKEDAYLHFRIGLTYYMLDDMENSRGYWNTSIEKDPAVADELVTTINNDIMLPTLMRGDVTIADNKYFDYIDPGYGDVIDFYIKNKADSILTSRIVGIPGDLIEIKNNNLLRNGLVVKESYANENKLSKLNMNKEKIRVPENNYYMLGDYRVGSSRNQYIGCITRGEIVGKFFIVIASEEVRNGDSEPREERFGLVIN